MTHTIDYGVGVWPESIASYTMMLAPILGIERTDTELCSPQTIDIFSTIADSPTPIWRWTIHHN